MAALRKLSFRRLDQHAVHVALELGFRSADGSEGSAPLAPALQALVPPGVALHSLDLSGRLQAEQLLGCSQLRQLQVLQLESLDSHAAVDAVLQQAPALQDLQLRLCYFVADAAGSGTIRGSSRTLPPAVVARAGLRALRLPSMGLKDLPQGPYLLGEAACFRAWYAAATALYCYAEA